MKCNRCGSEMREKNVITGEDDYGDPTYSRYAFCDNCRIKRKIADNVIIAPSPAPAAPKRRKKDYTDELPVQAYKKNPKKKKKSAPVLNTLILILTIVNIALLIFIIFVMNKHNFANIEGLKSLFSSKSSQSMQMTEEQKLDLSGYEIISKELEELQI